MKRIIASLLILLSVQAMADNVAVGNHAATQAAVTPVGTQVTASLSTFVYRGVVFHGYVAPGPYPGSYSYIGFIANTRNSSLQVRLITAAEAETARTLRSSSYFNGTKVPHSTTFTYLDPAMMGGTNLEVGKGWRFDFAGKPYWYNPAANTVTSLTPAQAQLLGVA